MKSNSWFKDYEGENTSFPTSSTIKSNNTMKANSKKTKRINKAKKSNGAEPNATNTNVNQTNATKTTRVTASTSGIKTGVSEPDIVKTKANKSKAALALLPVEILRDIFELLWNNDRQAFTSFCCTSKILRLNSEYLFFRTLVLSDKHDKIRQVTSSVLRKLVTDDECNLWTCMRHIKVGPIANTNWFYTTVYPALCQVLGRVENLRSLTWRTPLLTTPDHSRTGHSDVLDVLQVSQPHAKLNYICRSRDHDGIFMPMDEAVLSSTQLHILDISICLNRKRKESPHSELQFLKECLVRGGSAKVLRFDIGESLFSQIVTGPLHQNATGAPLNFQWEGTDRFPALEELSLPESHRPVMPIDKWAYDLKRDNLLKWAQVMDWTHMRRLDFHSNGPSLFFEIFTDRVPNLKYLRWGTSHEADISGYGGSPTCASAFMASVTALDEVVFSAWHFNDFVRGILEILNAQGPKLKSLTLECTARNGEGFTLAQYWDLLERAPKLEYLKISSCGAFLNGVWEGKDSRLSPAEKWSTSKRNESTLKPIGVRYRNDSHHIWVPGQRLPGRVPGQGFVSGHRPIPAPRRNYESAASYQSPYEDWFG